LRGCVCGCGGIGMAVWAFYVYTPSFSDFKGRN
jgi:hypothetical protein